MRLPSLIVGALAGLLVLASIGTVEARRGDHSDRSDRAERSDRHDRSDRRERADRSQDSERSGRDGISLNEAVARVQRDTGGRVLSAESHERRGAASYRIKVLLPNGAVRVYYVDAHDGRMR